jgi:hypothetical protein
VSCSSTILHCGVPHIPRDRQLTGSNGATPVALWLGHLLFELPSIFFVSTILTVLFATTSSQFTALGYMWVCLLLYGIASTLYGYMFALFLNSALASWALVAGSNVVIFMLYL